jgi:PAS domain S-box-containing protein
MWAAYLILVIALIPTGIAYQRSRQIAREKDEARFDLLVQNAQDGMVQRINNSVDELKSLRGFVAATEGLTEVQWSNYLATVEFERRFPGIWSVGFVERVPVEARGSHEREMRAAGDPDYRIFPDGPRKVYFPLVHVAEFAGGERIRGWDAYMDTNQATAMDTAGASGESTATVRVELSRLGSKPVPGFRIFLPVYRIGAPIADKEQRVAALRGFVYGTFEADKLLRGIFGDPANSSIDRRVYDGGEAKRVRLLYDDVPASQDESGVRPEFSREVPVVVANRRWTLDFATLPNFADPSQQRVPLMVLFGCCMGSALVFFIAWAQVKARSAAERYSEDLNRVQERNRLLQRATNDALWDWDVPTGKLIWNEAVQAMFGYSAEKIKPTVEWWQEQLHPDDRRRIVNGRDSAIQTGGEFWADEYRFRRGDGSFATVIDRGFIIHDGQGQSVRMIGSMVDITGHRLAEEARRKSEQKLSLHIEQTPLAVIEWDLEFRVNEWNPAAEKIFGYLAREVVGRSGLELIVAPGVRPHVEKIWQELLSDTVRRGMDDEPHGGRRSVNENLTKDGRTIICAWYNTPLIAGNGQVVGVASLALDITASKKAEDALAAEKERLAVTLRSIGDGVITTDIDGRINLINKAAEDFTGWPQATALGRPLTEVFHIVVPKTREPCDDPVKKVLETGANIDFRANATLVDRSSRERPVATSAAPIRDKDSHLIGAVLVFRDMSEQQSLVNEMLRATKLDSLGILAGGIAHDFNNILTAIIGNLSIAKLLTDDNKKLHSRLDEAEKASLRAKDLTQQLLTFAKGGAPVKQTASIADLIRDSAEFTLRGSNVRCDFAFAPDLWPADIDQGQISQVINNLVINAMQAMPEGGIVQIRAENLVLANDSSVPMPAGRYVRFSVTDNGTGIRAEHLAKIFDPYFTTKQKGSGLGLATSYSIVKKHEGHISVDSTLGVGTAFHVLLPASTSKVRPASETSVEPVRGQGYILIMDDEPLIRELAVTILDYLGYDSKTAADGNEAVTLYTAALASPKPFTAVIMDLTIPGGTGGRETIKRLLAINPDVLAIVSSGYSNDPVMANYLQYGFKGVVSKPYRIDEIAKVLDEVINPKPAKA